MVSVYNDEDIIGEVIAGALSQGLELVILDNGSTDSSFEICKKLQNDKILQINQFKTDTHNEFLIYRMLYIYRILHWSFCHRHI